VAANALYTRDQLLARAVGQQGSPERDTVLYVGRLEPEKKTMLLIEALPYIPSHLRLGIAGTGSLRAEMERRAVELGVAPRVDFHGWVDDLEALRVLYAKAVCSISPGFAGLGLTQSAGFGVPQVVSRDEKHSPEIELEAAGAVVWFDTDSVEDLAEKVTEISRSSSTLPRRELIGAVASTYSADRMADGISDALLGKQDSYGDER
jgi:glycosyltransferase involved in cell wall biosynthesis